MKRVLLTLLLALFLVAGLRPASAQQPFPNPPGSVALGWTVTTCGSYSPWTAPGAGVVGPFTVNPAGQLCSTGGGGSGGNVSITSPVDGSGNVKVNCETGCSGSALNVAPLTSPGTGAPAYGAQLGYWNSTTWVPAIGTANGLSVDETTASQFHTDIVTGTAGFGNSWPGSGIANGTKGSGATAIINPLWAADSSAVIAIASGTGYVEAVAGVTGQLIRVFGYQVTVSANTALTWGWSASTSCTSVTALTGAMLFISGIGLQGIPIGGLSFTVPAGDTLCLSSGTSASVQGIVSYQQSP
jgi:hypothetical protein